MRNTTTVSPIKLALLFSLSFTTTTTTNSLRFPTNPKPPRQISFSHKVTPTDLLTLLGPKAQSSKLDPTEAHDLWSCLKFLAPSNPTPVKRRSMLIDSSQSQRRESDENELIWWPPDPVLELARLSVDSGGDVGVIHRALDPTMIPVPDVDGSKESRCELTRTPYGRHFIHEELNAYLGFLFRMIVSRGPRVGLNVSLSLYDFFHGHMFLAKDTGRLGILFHAKEYPAYDKQVFPFNMGYCQTGSDVVYDDEMNLRNILWLAPMPSNSSSAWMAPGVLVILDAHPEGIIYRDLIPDYVKVARTLYEDDFGEVAVDVNYLNVGATSPDYQIFIC